MNIINNTSLTSLFGLQNIEPNSITDLGIYSNSILDECDIQSVCEYLVDPVGTIEIFDNAPGCDNQEEVEEACFNAVADFESENTFSISPNPNSGSVNIQFTISDQRFVICDLFEISGVRIKGLLNEEKLPGTYDMEFDLSDLPQGVYFCVFKTNPEGSEHTRKLIKI